MFWDSKLKKTKRKLEEARFEKAIELLESLPTFVRDNDEDEWRSLTGDKEIYTEQNMKTMRTNALNFYYTNPHARAIIDTMIKFVIGKTLEITPIDTENEELVDYWKKFQNVNNMDGRLKEFVKRTIRDGEQFTRYFPGKDGIPRIRFIDPGEIKDNQNNYSYGIETNPDDVEEPVNYYREYFANNTEHREVIPAEDILHTKIMVDSNVKRGISFLTGTYRYIKHYDKWLEDRVKINHMRTIFNVIGEVTTPSTVSSIKSQLESSTTKKSNTPAGDYQKKLPKSGGVLMNKGIKWDLKNLNIAAGDAKADGRAILLMIVAATGFAEYMVTGDSNNANFASTMVAESPAIKTFESWQDFFEIQFKSIYDKVIHMGIESGEIAETDNMECKIVFPNLLYRDMNDETKAISQQVAEGFCARATGSQKLGYNYEEEKVKIIQEQEETLKREAEIVKKEMSQYHERQE